MLSSIDWPSFGLRLKKAYVEAEGKILIEWKETAFGFLHIAIHCYHKTYPYQFNFSISTLVGWHCTSFTLYCYVLTVLCSILPSPLGVVAYVPLARENEIGRIFWSPTENQISDIPLQNGNPGIPLRGKVNEYIYQISSKYLNCLLIVNLLLVTNVRMVRNLKIFRSKIRVFASHVYYPCFRWLGVICK
jgi:hypothetical protein